jgi:hypothetical protein
MAIYSKNQTSTRKNIDQLILDASQKQSHIILAEQYLNKFSTVLYKSLSDILSALQMADIKLFSDINIETLPDGRKQYSFLWLKQKIVFIPFIGVGMPPKDSYQHIKEIAANKDLQMAARLGVFINTDEDTFETIYDFFIFSDGGWVGSGLSNVIYTTSMADDVMLEFMTEFIYRLMQTKYLEWAPGSKIDIERLGKEVKYSNKVLLVKTVTTDLTLSS